MATAASIPDLVMINEQHEILRQECANDLAAIRDDSGRRGEFLDRVHSFLADLQRCVPEARTTAAANSVNRMASEWQMIFTSDLRIPKNIYALLEIDRVPDKCEPILSETVSRLSRREMINNRVRERAYLISKDWKVNWLKRLLFAFTSRPDQIHEVVLTPPHRSAIDDWREACICFACDVLDARIDLALQLSVDGFEYLENVWLEDVKRFKAYLSWEATRPDGSLDDPHWHYHLACQGIHNRLLDPAIKAGPESFAPIVNWFREFILDGDRVNTTTRPHAHALISAKAHRLWERTKCTRQTFNWSRAEEYVRTFYENLIPAVVNEDRHSVETILAATTIGAGTHANCEIVNALEVALITYFFNPTLMMPYFEKHATYV